MTTWNLLSECQPTDEDFKVGVVFGFGHLQKWGQSAVFYHSPCGREEGWTHWQRVSPPEQPPRLRRWWIDPEFATGGACGFAYDYPYGNRIPVVHWPYPEDPVRKEGGT